MIGRCIATGYWHLVVFSGENQTGRYWRWEYRYGNIVSVIVEMQYEFHELI